MAVEHRSWCSDVSDVHIRLHLETLSDFKPTTIHPVYTHVYLTQWWRGGCNSPRNFMEKEILSVGILLK